MFRTRKQYASIIGRDTTFTGTFLHKGHIKVDGCVVGDIDVEQITVAKGAVIEGNVKAAAATIDGSIHGNVIARELLKVQCHGRITGDVIAVSLGVEEGGEIDGRVSMKMESAEVIRLTDERIQENRMREKPADPKPADVKPVDQKSREFRPGEIRLKQVRKAEGGGTG